LPETSRRPSPSRWPASPPLQAARREAEIDRAREVDKGHGRIEERSIQVTTSLAEYLGSDWPGCQQVFRLKRVRKTGEKIETEVVLGITSRSRQRAGAKELLGLTRGHWGIENGLHGVRDGTLREDASRIRKGTATQTMAILRNLVIFLFKRLGHDSAAAATRHYVCHPEKSLEVLSTPR
jgi:predicted transposase YbfD/YdcC